MLRTKCANFQLLTSIKCAEALKKKIHFEDFVLFFNVVILFITENISF